MAKRFYRQPQRSEPKERINEDIDASTVRVIPPNGEHKVMGINEAIEFAAKLNMDLVEVSPQSTPPVCKVMDFGKYQFEKKKKEKEAKKKQHTVSVKELRFRPHTDDHDYNFKMNHAIGFLKDGDKVKATVQFRGRDIIYSEKGEELLARFANDLEDLSKIEQKATLEGKRMSIILTPTGGKK